jgi:hypothetical protein
LRENAEAAIPLKCFKKVWLDWIENLVDEVNDTIRTDEVGFADGNVVDREGIFLSHSDPQELADAVANQPDLSKNVSIDAGSMNCMVGEDSFTPVFVARRKECFLRFLVEFLERGIGRDENGQCLARIEEQVFAVVRVLEKLDEGRGLGGRFEASTDRIFFLRRLGVQKCSSAKRDECERKGVVTDTPEKMSLTGGESENDGFHDT